MLLQLKNDGPLYRQVADSVREKIRSGRWPGGMRLPGTRTLARDLGVSRIVVLVAYEQLAAEGYLQARSRSGSRVTDRVADRLEQPRATPRKQRRPGPLSPYAERARALEPQAFPPPERRPDSHAIDFSYTRTLPDEGTLQSWRRALSRAAAKPLLDYPDPAGSERLRKLIADDLREQRGVIAGAEDVVVVNGSQQALDITARLLVGEGTSIGIEDPHYQGTRQAFLAAGATLIPCPVDEDGLDIGRNAGRLRGARAVCVTPSHQFPTGAVMTAARRLELLSWAAAEDAWIVEDDYESEFRHGVGAISALQGLDTHGRVVYLGTFARSLFPALRLGYVVVPRALRNHFRAIKWLADRGSSPTEQQALAELMESGAFERARRRLGRLLAHKRNALVGALRATFAGREVASSGATSGTHVFLRLRGIRSRETSAIVRRAARRGVRVYSGLPYFLRPPREATLILGYATVREEDIERGISRLGRALADHSAARCRSAS
jgi:GntR family transcriptional regulator / MocR family aminotransferase